MPTSACGSFMPRAFISLSMRYMTKMCARV